jgi:hypothetical protein
MSLVKYSLNMVILGKVFENYGNTCY